MELPGSGYPERVQEWQRRVEALLRGNSIRGHCLGAKKACQ
jgi:hypothetical protein